MYQKRAGGGGGLAPKNLCTQNGKIFPMVNYFVFSHDGHFGRGAGGGGGGGSDGCQPFSCILAQGSSCGRRLRIIVYAWRCMP